MKVFVSQLWNDIFGIGTLSPSSQQTQLYLRNTEITSTMLWIQGIITSIQVSPTDALLLITVDDGTSTIACVNAKRQCNMPKGALHTFAVGDYVMVYGHPVLEHAIVRTDLPAGCTSRKVPLASQPSSVIYTFQNVCLEVDSLIFLGNTQPNLETLWIADVLTLQAHV